MALDTTSHLANSPETCIAKAIPYKKHPTANKKNKMQTKPTDASFNKQGLPIRQINSMLLLQWMGGNPS